MKTIPTITLSSYVQRNPELIANQMDGEIVMMSIENGEYYGLDEIGSRIWELLGNALKVELLVEKLMEEFEVDKAQCTDDTLDFLQDLLEKKLLLLKDV